MAVPLRCIRPALSISKTALRQPPSSSAFATTTFASPSRAFFSNPNSSKRRRQSAFPASRTLENAGTRMFHATAGPQHGTKPRPKAGEGIKLTFKKSDGTIIKEVEANEGEDIVDVSWAYDLDIEAACEKSVACSTCHVILEEDVFDKLMDQEEISDDENDMLDLAFGLTDTSRLGCQVKISKIMDGTTITLPSATRNLRVDGSKPTPH